jgi:glycosyltransferase involved in cell wall biosynthesis
MACGCPTIVSRAGSLPEICGDAVVYFDPHDPRELADTLVQVLSDKSMREGLRQRGRRHAERFSWNRCAAQTIQIMEELVHP